MARSISKGPKPRGGYAKVSATALAMAKDKQAKRQQKTATPSSPALKKPPAQRTAVYSTVANTVQSALLNAQKHGIAKVDARLLLLHVLGKDHADTAWLIAHDHDVLTPVQADAYSAACARRRAAEPVAYITGCKEFYSLRLAIDNRVLDPRDDTETLVDWALELVPAAATGITVLDLGTGSGAIALALQSQRPSWQVHATDASASALDVAQANAHTHQLAIQFHLCSWFNGLDGEKFHLIVSNPPYIAVADPHLANLGHEPLSALASGEDGLADIRQIITQAPQHLHPGAWLLLEHGYDQADRVRALLDSAGFAQVQSRKDLANVERCSGGVML